MHAVPIRPQKQMIHPAVPNSDTLVDASMTGYPVDMDQGLLNLWERTTYSKLLQNSSRAGHLA